MEGEIKLADAPTLKVVSRAFIPPCIRLLLTNRSAALGPVAYLKAGTLAALLILLQSRFCANRRMRKKPIFYNPASAAAAHYIGSCAHLLGTFPISLHNARDVCHPGI